MTKPGTCKCRFAVTPRWTALHSGSELDSYMSRGAQLKLRTLSSILSEHVPLPQTRDGGLCIWPGAGSIIHRGNLVQGLVAAHTVVEVLPPARCRERPSVAAYSSRPLRAPGALAGCRAGAACPNCHLVAEWVTSKSRRRTASRDPRLVDASDMLSGTETQERCRDPELNGCVKCGEGRHVGSAQLTFLASFQG